MRPKVLYVVALILLVGAIAVAWLVFPTRYGCDDDQAEFTSSHAEAVSVCVNADGPDPVVVANPRITPRAGLIATTLFVALILLRLGSGLQEQRELLAT